LIFSSRSVNNHIAIVIVDFCRYRHQFEHKGISMNINAKIGYEL
jgi:hypothetical protein